MKSKDRVLRCYAVQDNGAWVAACLDFSLAAQGDSFPEAKEKLEAMIQGYVEDAIVGEDREYADYFLKRKAPLSEWLRYYYYKLGIFLGAFKDNLLKLFPESISLDPSKHHA
ncbi:MAG: DUF1902 domain-containing protein [Ketobacter sp.]|nr:DUF1902 domain-containing protein [Ketobacter sp.]